MDTSILQGRRILIVEDDYFAASELRAAFEECGCEILGPPPVVS